MLPVLLDVPTLAFSPKRYGDLRADYDARKLTIADGVAVPTFSDFSGRGNHATAASGQRALMDVDGIGGKPALLFDGTDDFYTSNSFLNSDFNTAFTFLIVSSKVNAALFRLTSSHDGTNFDWYSARNNTGSDDIVLFNTGALTDTATSAIVTDGTAPLVEMFTYNGSVKRLYVNGVLATQENATGNLGLSGALTIGKLEAGNNQWDGRIARMILWATAFDTVYAPFISRRIAAQHGLLL